jgi:adenosine deaminase
MHWHRNNRLLLAFVVFANVSAGAPDPRIDRRFAELRRNPPELYAFLYRMPKGGDLHNHLSGAVYAESYLRAAAEDHLCIDPKTMALLKPATLYSKCGTGLNPAAAAQTDNTLAGALIDAFSMRNFVPGAQSGHDHFFATFNKFGAVDSSHNGEFAAEVTQRAADQNESYLELMALSGGSVAGLGQKAGLDVNNFDVTRKNLEAAGLTAAVNGLHNRVDQIEAGRMSKLGCANKSDSPACRVVVRYVYQVLREFPKEQVFAQVMAGFALVASDPRVVAVNFVQPEDGLNSMRDYHLHMQMVDYAHRLWPDVHISLHAGELAPGLVPPEGLRFHIRDAVELGHAERIGHGVDVMYEKDPAGLLAEMHDRNIAVEINLTSNDAILGVRADRHPLPAYRKYRVPVTLSTDDEGVSRSNLTLEYQRAVMDYNLTYADLKEIVRNSIEYSFLPKGEKARIEADLDGRFNEFERTVK